MRKTFISTAAALAALTATSALAQEDTGKRFVVALEPGQEVLPATGDPDGAGMATLRVNAGQKQVCYSINVTGLTLPAVGAHIHRNVAGANGPVVVGFTPPNANGSTSGCVTVTRDLALAIIRNPENYYVNVHTPGFTAGAIRGQLER